MMGTIGYDDTSGASPVRMGPASVSPQDARALDAFVESRGDCPFTYTIERIAWALEEGADVFVTITSREETHGGL